MLVSVVYIWLVLCCFWWLGVPQFFRPDTKCSMLFSLHLNYVIGHTKLKNFKVNDYQTIFSFILLSYSFCGCNFVY